MLVIWEQRAQFLIKKKKIVNFLFGWWLFAVLKNKLDVEAAIFAMEYCAEEIAIFVFEITKLPWFVQIKAFALGGSGLCSFCNKMRKLGLKKESRFWKTACNSLFRFLPRGRDVTIKAFTSIGNSLSWKN